MYISMLVAHSAKLGRLTGYYWNNVIDDIMWKVVNNVLQSNQFREIVKITEEKENNKKHHKKTHTRAQCCIDYICNHQNVCFLLLLFLIIIF